jgi:PRTRC genetic system protein A
VTPVEYLVARDGPPARRGLAYDYVLGGDGLYVAAEGRYVKALIPVAPARVRGLPPLCPAVELPAGRLPQALWDQIVAVAADRPEREVLLAVRAELSGYRLIRPLQIGGALRVVYRPTADVLLQIHSHGAYSARFSATDDADEQGFGVYGVVGGLLDGRPQVALRVGVYGYFWPLAWEAVFLGERGSFEDLHGDPEEGDDGIPD